MSATCGASIDCAWTCPGCSPRQAVPVPGGAYVRAPGTGRHLPPLDRLDALVTRSRTIARTIGDTL